ncbi:hypothetical protein [Vibrio sp. R78045]|uniref:hypothetical protein n=1 Tax=Vibrio sp. R78045 TaxID=3093868 RepID=UPI0036F28B75
MDKTGFNEFRDSHIMQFSPQVRAMWSDLEAKESWTIDESISGITKIFNTLPSVCKYPLSEKTEQALSDLIGLIAYLPFKDSVCALAWCGFNSNEWGNAIYSFAYEVYSSAYDNIELQRDNSVIAAKTIVMRIEAVNQIAIIQTITGRVV